MIRLLYNYITKSPALPSVYIDGFLYVAIAWLTFSQMYLGGDEAAKYISPAFKFWLNFIIGGLAIKANSLKSFRSTGFSDHLKDKAEKQEKQSP